MENIFGLIVFILFIVARAMIDRNRGMAKKPGKKKQPAAVTVPRRAENRGESPQKPRLASPAPKPSFDRPKPLVVKGDSVYRSVPYMEGAEPELLKEQPGYTQTVFGSAEQDSILTNEDLKKAVIWSEILQKPRFRTRPRYSR